MDSDKIQIAEEIFSTMKTRRSTRRFSSVEINLDLIKLCIKAANTAPSGANKQPWFFVVVTDPAVKKNIRTLAEAEEKHFYQKAASEQTLCDLKPLGTTWEKPHLEEASALIVIFGKNFDYIDEQKTKCYYTKESVGIATGFLIFSLHQLGFATLTHTPQPMSFLNDILERPQNEKPFLILAVGQAHPEHVPPLLAKKEFEQTCLFI